MKAIVLAAGLSKRMKRQKLLLPFGEGSILSTVLANLMSAELFDKIILITSRETLARFEVSHPGLLSSMQRSLFTVVNEHPEVGQAGSLHLGVEAIREGDFCVTLGDLPLITADQYVAYAGKFFTRSTEFTALVPRRMDVLGHPIFFSALWRERLTALDGDAGGRSVIRKHEREVLWTEGLDASFQDVDTAEDYAAIAHNDKT